MYDNVDDFVEGEMNIPSAKTATLGQPDFNTLDEPIKDTIVCLQYNFYIRNCRKHVLFVVA